MRALKLLKASTTLLNHIESNEPAEELDSASQAYAALAANGESPSLHSHQIPN